MIEFLVECAQAGGAVLERHFGRLSEVRTKENVSSVVTEADLASERCIFDRIRARFPDDGLLGEESGYAPGRSDRVWVVDPLDGTSNFVAGLPWFGVMIALLEHQTPVLAALHLPAMNSLYTAELGRGARRNGEAVRVTTETDLARVLMGFGFDASADAVRARREALLVTEVARRARNIRATNSLVDFCYTADGRLGGALNLACKLWDIAAPVLLLREAGGVVTNLAGQEPDFRLDDAAALRTHTMLAAPPALHRQLRALVAEVQQAEIER